MTEQQGRLSMAEYLALKALSSGTLHTLLTVSPYHAWHDSPLNPDREPENAQVADMGSAADELLLGGESRIVEIPFDDYRKKDAQAMRDAAYAAGQTPVLARKMPGLRAMVAEARAFLSAPDCQLRGVLDDGEPQQTVVWKQGPVTLKMRPDWWSADRRILLHYKTTESTTTPERFIRGQFYSMGYYLAGRFYEIGAMADGADAPESFFLVQSQEAPYACFLVGSEPGYRELADRECAKAIAIWRECLKSGKWPKFPGSIHYAAPAAWQMAEVEHGLDYREPDRLTEEELEGGLAL